MTDGHTLNNSCVLNTRIEKIDLLDEKELLEQLLQHYTLSCGINDSNNQGRKCWIIH